MAVIAATGKSRNWVAALRRVMDSAWHGTTNNTEQAPLALSNESILAVNNAGTGTVALIKAATDDTVHLPTATTADSTLTVTGTLAATGATTLTGGVVPVGSPPGMWAMGYSPDAVTSGTSTQGVGNQQWIAPVWVPANVTLTGAAFLIGTTGGTDRAIAALYNNAGVLVANSSFSSSGAIVGTASTIQSLAFTGTYAATGPARYWLSIQTNGTTARLQTVPLGVSFTAVQAAGTAAPLASITVPTSFTAGQAPIASLY